MTVTDSIRILMESGYSLKGVKKMQQPIGTEQKFKDSPNASSGEGSQQEPANVRNFADWISPVWDGPSRENQPRLKLNTEPDE